MKRLTLVRHAKSSWNDPGLSDFERPLDDRGRRDAPLMAERVSRLGPAPDLILSSPATRALTTARAFGTALGTSPAQIQHEPRIYDASLESLIEVLRDLENAHARVLMFGHNPGFSQLAHWLAACPFDEMPTCAVASFELQIASWQELGPGCGRLVRYLYPKDGGG